MEHSLRRQIASFLAAATVTVTFPQRLDTLMVGHHRPRRLFSAVIVDNVLFADAPWTQDVTGTRPEIQFNQFPHLESNSLTGTIRTKNLPRPIQSINQLNN